MSQIFTSRAGCHSIFPEFNADFDTLGSIPMNNTFQFSLLSRHDECWVAFRAKAQSRVAPLIMQRIERVTTRQLNELNSGPAHLVQPRTAGGIKVAITSYSHPLLLNQLSMRVTCFFCLFSFNCHFYSKQITVSGTQTTEWCRFACHIKYPWNTNLKKIKLNTAIMGA